MEVLVSGSSGFVGKNLIDYFDNLYKIIKIKRLNNINLQHKEFDVVYWENLASANIDPYAIIHLAGKAHDLKRVSNYDEYYKVNTELTKQLFDFFLNSNAKVFIMLSSIKAVADYSDEILTEDSVAAPETHYGKSKLLAEQYINSKLQNGGKRVYILRPTLIHGPYNKGNLNLLYRIVNLNLPWPFASFENKRSYCSIDNLCFIIKELMLREDIPSGTYNVADDIPVSTNEIVQWIAESKSKKVKLLFIPKVFIKIIANLGDLMLLPINSSYLRKITGTNIVSNQKLKNALRKPLPKSAKEGFLETFNSFNS